MASLAQAKEIVVKARPAEGGSSPMYAPPPIEEVIAAIEEECSLASTFWSGKPLLATQGQTASFQPAVLAVR